MTHILVRRALSFSSAWGRNSRVLSRPLRHPSRPVVVVEAAEMRRVLGRLAPPQRSLRNEESAGALPVEGLLTSATARVTMSHRVWYTRSTGEPECCESAQPRTPLSNG